MMFSTLMELQKLHPPEDEILNQYLVPAICKAAAVLGMVGVLGRCFWLIYVVSYLTLFWFFSIVCALWLHTCPGQSNCRACVPPVGDDPSQHPPAQPHGSSAWTVVCVGVWLARWYSQTAHPHCLRVPLVQPQGYSSVSTAVFLYSTTKIMTKLRNSTIRKADINYTST